LLTEPLCELLVLLCEFLALGRGGCLLLLKREFCPVQEFLKFIDPFLKLDRFPDLVVDRRRRLF
jgi:hypothetical protein